MKKKSVVALIPARSGSKRVPDKNIRLLDGYPMMAYTISAAVDSGIFDAVIVSTDSKEYAEIAHHFGAEVPFLRPIELATATSPDIDWVEYTLKELKTAGRVFDCFSILRPTSPFRQVNTIRRAWNEFLADEDIDSLRAVEKCVQHPGKMWQIQGSRMVPLMSGVSSGQPWHSSQYTALPEIYIQNASLEIAWTRVVFDERSIAGNIIKPFFTEGLEGFDINHAEDWLLAELYLARGEAYLPQVLQRNKMISSKQQELTWDEEKPLNVFLV